MLLVLCLLLFSSLPWSDSRRCCPLGEELDELDDLPHCDDANQTDHCLDFFNKTVCQVDCQGENSETDSTWPHIPLCCPYGFAYSSTQFTCINKNITEETDKLLWELIPGDELIGDFGPLSDCNFNQAIIDTPIYSLEDVIFDNNDKKTTFTIRNHPPELTQGDYCFALHDDPESTLVIRSCIPKEKACTSDRICLRQCCKDGYGFYGSVMRCRPIWQPYPIEIYEKSDDNFTLFSPKPFSMAIVHRIKCKVYRVNNSVPENKWNMLSDGTLQLGTEIIESDRFCVENFQLDSFKEMGVLACGVEEYTPKFYLFGIGMIVSCIFLIVTFIVYLILPQMHNLHGKTLICYVSWLIICYITFAIIYFESHDSIYCYILGFVAYLSFMSASAWMNIMSFDIWFALGDTRNACTPIKKRQRENHRFAFYAAYATAIGFTLTSITLFAQFSDMIPIEYSPGIKQETCFLQHRHYAKVIYFITPLAIMYTANIIFFFLTVKNFLKIRSQIEKLQDTSKENKQKILKRNMVKFATNAKLFVVMGAIWIFEVLSVKVSPSSWVWYLPNTANVFHGVIIFCIYILKKNIFKQLKLRFNCGSPIIDNEISTSISNTTSLGSSSSTINKNSQEFTQFK